MGAFIGKYNGNHENMPVEKLVGLVLMIIGGEFTSLSIPRYRIASKVPKNP